MSHPSVTYLDLFYFYRHKPTNTWPPNLLKCFQTVFLGSSTLTFEIPRILSCLNELELCTKLMRLQKLKWDDQRYVHARKKLQDICPLFSYPTCCEQNPTNRIITNPFISRISQIIHFDEAYTGTDITLKRKRYNRNVRVRKLIAAIRTEIRTNWKPFPKLFLRKRVPFSLYIKIKQNRLRCSNSNNQSE